MACFLLSLQAGASYSVAIEPRYFLSLALEFLVDLHEWQGKACYNLTFK